MNDVAFPRRPNRRRSPSIASARRTWNRRYRLNGGDQLAFEVYDTAKGMAALRVRSSPGQRSDFVGSVEADVKWARVRFDAHYLGTATVRVS